ncbi:hypothetical protein CMEL01_14431 [Colletotrichum melonis]|uniref:Uncharacterized protein n=1 Tax=Colletotrichum melonis TaxID=1209925 RepID=A0AAI9XUW8_9PEZI|nr:hypothetical protein CMEL01_14431 [Colletotrichum melonis]
MMDSGVSLINFGVLLMIVTMVVQDVRIASIWTKRDRITTVGVGGWECARNIRAATRDNRGKSASNDGEKFEQQNKTVSARRDRKTEASERMRRMALTVGGKNEDGR